MGRLVLPLLGLAACVERPEPRPGTQIGVEESGGCEDDTVTPVDEVPEGAGASLAEALAGAVGRFVGATRDDEALTFEVEGEVDSAVWVTQRPLESTDPAACPPLWRLEEVVAVVRTDEVDWTGSGSMSLQGDGGAAIRVDGPADVGMEPPPDVDAQSARAFAFGGNGVYTLSLVWRGRAGVDGDAVEAVALQGDVESD